MDRIVRENLALVKFVARRFLGRGREYEDLYQLGCLGLVKAIKNFDTSFEVKFSTYAVPVIMGEIRRFLRDDGPLRVSRSIRDNARRIAAFVEREESESGKAPELSRIAAALELNIEEVALALGSLLPTRSLFEPLGPDGRATIADTVGEDKTEEIDRRIEIDRLLSTLDERERRILVMRYFDRATQSRVAETFGMTQVQVSRLESRLLKKLRERAYA